MKTHFLSIILLLNTIVFLTNQISAQSSFQCVVGSQNDTVSVFRGQDCARNSVDFINKYARKEHYIPLSDSVALKKIHVSFHFYQMNDGTGNWQDLSNWEEEFETIKGWVNQRLRYNNPAPNPPLQYSLPYPNLIDSKIEMVVDSMYFYPNTTFYNGSHELSDLNSFIIGNYPERARSLMIHFYPWSHSSGQAAGASIGPNGSSALTAGSIVTNQIDPNSVGTYFLSSHLTHELVHSLGLGHTYDTQGHSSFGSFIGASGIQRYQHCLKDNFDFCWDVFDSTFSTHNQTAIYNCSQACNTCYIISHASENPELNNNNVMGGKNDLRVSPLQMGIMQRTTVLQNVRDFVSGHTEIPHFVNSDETWDFSMKFYQNIVVKTGAKLTVKCEIQMSPQTKIIVEPGASLIIDGGIITNERYFNLLWKGIEVLGNPSLNQTNANQGEVRIINGGTIEYALVGVSLGAMNTNGTPNLSTTGGFVRGYTGATFLNCRQAVRAFDYQSPNGAPNRTVFNNTTFEISEELPGGVVPQTQVQLRGVNGVVFNTSKFLNSRSDEHSIYHAGSGISSGYSGFKVTACEFENLLNGIKVKSLGFDNISVQNSTFNLNLQGVQLRYSGIANVAGNTFLVPTPNEINFGGNVAVEPYGIYLIGSTGYEVEENSFFSTDIHKNVGIAIRNLFKSNIQEHFSYA